MRGSVVEIEIGLFDVLAVVPFVPAQAERPLLQDRIRFVPERDAETDYLVAVAEPGQAVFVPPVGAGSGMVERKELPGAAVRAVVFTYGAPGAVGDIRAPPVPVHEAAPGLIEALFFAGHPFDWVSAWLPTLRRWAPEPFPSV